MSMARILAAICWPILILGFATGCSKPSVMVLFPEEMYGEFIHSYKSGALESLELKPDKTFIQKLFTDASARSQGRVKYTYSGRWLVSNATNYTIGFVSMFAFDPLRKSEAPNEEPNPITGAIPDSITGITAFWEPPDANSKIDRLVFDQEMDYAFVRVRQMPNSPLPK